MDEEPINRLLRAVNRRPTPEIQPIVQKERPLRLQLPKNAEIDTLYWMDDKAISGELPPDHVEVKVMFNGVNAVDVDIATGQSHGLQLGLDAAGFVTRVGASVGKLSIGQRVAVCHTDAFATHIRVSQQMVHVLPENVSLELAASIPHVYTAAAYGIFDVAHLSKGERVLVTQATGGLGQALISLAQYMGAEVYAIVSSEEKRAYLTERFGIPSSNILSSVGTALLHKARTATAQQGFDVVFNTLGGENLSVLCDSVAPFGRFVDYNQEDVKMNASLQMRPLGQNISFTSVDTVLLMQKYPARASKLLERVISLLESRIIDPANPSIYDWTHMAAAFAAIRDRTRVGKIVLHLTNQSEGLVVPKESVPLKLHASGTYVISGGMGGIGRAVACYLADHGARHIVLLSRSSEIKGDAKRTMNYLENLDVDVRVMICDITDEAAVATAIHTISADMPKIKGLVHGAMLLSDGLFEKMTYEQWLVATRPKIEGTWNLHKHMPDDLDFFIMLSSIAGICGNLGQANYAAGNTYQDAMAHYRRSLGLKACVIDLGAIGNFGWLQDNITGSTFGEQMKHLVINPDELFTILTAAITGCSFGGAACPVQLITGIGTGGSSLEHLAAGGQRNYYWLDDQGRFAYLRYLGARTSTSNSSTADKDDIKLALAGVTTLSDAATIVQSALVNKLARAMMIAPGEIDVNRPITSYGVDSLVAAKLRNWCVQEIQSQISVFEFLNAVPISILVWQIVEKIPPTADSDKRAS